LNFAIVLSTLFATSVFCADFRTYLNVAQDKPARLSTVDGPYQAGRAVDGNAQSILHTCARSRLETNPHLEIDLLHEFDISDIVIYTRNVEGVYFANAELLVGATDAVEDFCGDLQRRAVDNEVLRFPCVKKNVRHVRLSLKKLTILQVCEIVVMGVRSDASKKNDFNVAKYMPAFQSSNYHTWVASKATDNCALWTLGEECSSMTNIQAKPWWTVEFGGPYKLDRVVIYNTLDAWTRLKGLYVETQNGDGPWEKCFSHDAQVGYGGILNKRCRNVATRLRITLNYQTYLQLSEVRVYGH
jgi:hypothetical protein